MPEQTAEDIQDIPFETGPDLPPVQRETLREIARLIGLDSTKQVRRIVFTREAVEITVYATRYGKPFFANCQEHQAFGHSVAELTFTVPVEGE